MSAAGTDLEALLVNILGLDATYSLDQLANLAISVPSAQMAASLLPATCKRPHRLPMPSRRAWHVWLMTRAQASQRRFTGSVRLYAAGRRRDLMARDHDTQWIEPPKRGQPHRAGQTVARNL